VARAGDLAHGDYQSNHAFRLGKALKLNPRAVAAALAAAMPPDEAIVGPPEVAGPGFLNFRLSDAWLAGDLAARGRDPRFLGPSPGAGQVLILDLVFSIDSVITAVGMTEYIGVMIVAVLTSVAIMLFASKAIYEFVNNHPTVKMLALSFLLLIGVTLVAEGLGQKIPKGYIYAAIAFSVVVEMLNIRWAARKKERAAPVHLHQSIVAD
jgi:hypothetical protein